MTRKGWLLFAAMSVIWGVPYFFIKIAVQELDPILIVFARVGIAALVLLPIAIQRDLLRPLRKHWLAVVVIALVQITGPFLLITYGEQHIASSLASLLIATEPLLIALLALRFDASERVQGLRLLGLFIGLLGVAVLLGFDVGGDELRLLGAAFILLATIGYAISALLLKRPSIVSLPSLGVLAVECAIVTVLLAPLALQHLPTHVPSLKVSLSLLVLGLVCTALAFLIFFALIAEVGAGRGTVFTYINPAVSVLLGVTLLGEPFTLATLAGFVLIIAGSWLSTGGRLPYTKPSLARMRQHEENSPHMRDKL